MVLHTIADKISQSHSSWLAEGSLIDIFNLADHNEYPNESQRSTEIPLTLSQ